MGVEGTGETAPRDGRCIFLLTGPPECRSTLDVRPIDCQSIEARHPEVTFSPHTVRLIATHANVSPPTVLRVLRREATRPSCRERVMRAIDQLAPSQQQEPPR